VGALQAQLNTQEADNLELATENSRCRALLEGDDRMADLTQEAGRIEMALEARQQECDALQVRTLARSSDELGVARFGFWHGAAENGPYLLPRHPSGPQCGLQSHRGD
jgi:hypothetical protein